MAQHYAGGEMNERDELAEIIGNTFHNEFHDPSGHTADAIFAAGYRKTDALLALIQEAESAFGSSSYCKITTYQLREALGMDVSTWIEDVIPAEAVEAAAKWWRCVRRGHLWTTDGHCARCSKGIPRSERTTK